MTDEEIASRLSCCSLGAERCAFAAGTIFGDWRLTAFISRGGTSEVYAAEHVTLGTPAAVKILLGTDPMKKGTDPEKMICCALRGWWRRSDTCLRTEFPWAAALTIGPSSRFF